MRRFTDPILFLALFALDALAWVVMASTGAIQAAAPDRIAPMTVGAIIVIACPALLAATVLGLARALIRTPPRGFYSWALGAAVICGIVVGLAGVPARAQGLEVGFSWMAWFFAVLALSFVVALVVALTGGIPGPAKDVPATAGERAGSAEVPAATAPATRAPTTVPGGGASPLAPGAAKVPPSGRTTGSATGPATGSTTGPGSAPRTSVPPSDDTPRPGSTPAGPLE